MPYKIFKQGNKWKVYKVKADGSKTGPAVGEHTSKAKAEKQLTALRINVEEIMSDMPIFNQDEKEEPAVEMYDDYELRYMPGYLEAQSFDDFDAVEEAAEMRERLQKRTDQLYELFWRIWNDDEIPIQQKAQPWKRIFDEFLNVFQKEAGMLEDLEAEEAVSEFSESATGQAIQVIHADLQENENRAPLYMEVELIQPGPGNKRDNHYYPAEVLERDAHIFEGVKMYVTNHNEHERSERTEVSQIEKIIGFSENGAPVARVAVFDPDFAEKTRNREKMGKLNTLECSILASGMAKSGKRDGQKYKIVEAITQAHAVDWVTRAGAGGRAIALAEHDELEVSMPESDKELAEVEEALEATKIHEQETEAETENETQPETEPAQVEDEQEPETETTPEEVTESDPVYLSEADVTAYLGETKLPVVSRERLLSQQYIDQAALLEAVKGEIAYIEALTGAGKPNAKPAQVPMPKQRTLAEIKEAQDAVNKRYGI